MYTFVAQGMLAMHSRKKNNIPPKTHLH